MGGSDIEVTLIDVINGLYRRVDSLSTFEIGGDTFTEIVINILCEEFKRKHKSSPIDNKRSMSKLKSNAESLKSILSTMERAHCSIDALFDGTDFDYYLDRDSKHLAPKALKVAYSRSILYCKRTTSIQFKLIK